MNIAKIVTKMYINILAAIRNMTLTWILIYSIQIEKKHDGYCWHCHEDDVEIKCTKCIRSFHQRCLNTDADIDALDFACNNCRLPSDVDK